MITIKIGNRTYTATESEIATRTHSDVGGFDIRSMRALDVYTPTGDTLSLDGTFFLDEIQSRLPHTEEEVTITFSSATIASTTIFAGIVEKVQKRVSGYNRIDVHIEARDYAKWIDRKLVSGVYTQATAPLMITAVINQYTNDFTTNNVSITNSMLPKVWNYVPGSEAFQEIADVTDSQWYIDGSRDIHFFPAESVTFKAPIELYDVDVNTVIGNLEITNDTSDIVNSLVVKDFYFRGPSIHYQPQEESSTGFPTGDTGIELNDSQKSVALDYPPYDLSEFTFELNETPESDTWVSKTPVWDITDSISFGQTALDNDKVYVKGGKESGTVRWGFTHAAGSHIRISYRPLLLNFFAEYSSDPLSINEFARRESLGGRTSDGIYEQVISMDDLEFSGDNPIIALQEFAQRILRQKAWPRVEGSFQVTSDSYNTLWHAGQSFKIVSRLMDIFDFEEYAKNSGWDLGLDPSDFPLTVWVTSAEIIPISYKTLLYKITFSNVMRPL